MLCEFVFFVISDNKWRSWDWKLAASQWLKYERRSWLYIVNVSLECNKCVMITATIAINVKVDEKPNIEIELIGSEHSEKQ